MGKNKVKKRLAPPQYNPQVDTFTRMKTVMPNLETYRWALRFAIDKYVSRDKGQNVSDDIKVLHYAIEIVKTYENDDLFKDEKETVEKGLEIAINNLKVEENV